MATGANKIPFANNVTLYNTTRRYMDFHTCTALDLNANGTRLTSASSLKGPDKILWEKAHGEKNVRLIESKTGCFVHIFEMPRDRTAAYYNPDECGNACGHRAKLGPFACANRIVYINVLECRRIGTVGSTSSM